MSEGPSSEIPIGEAEKIVNKPIILSKEKRDEIAESLRGRGLILGIMMLMVEGILLDLNHLETKLKVLGIVLSEKLLTKCLFRECILVYTIFRRE